MADGKDAITNNHNTSRRPPPQPTLIMFRRAGALATLALALMLALAACAEGVWALCASSVRRPGSRGRQYKRQRRECQRLRHGV